MAVQKSRKYAFVDQLHCVACGCCIKVCPKGAISVPRGIHAVVNTAACIGCGLCAKVCPASVITVRAVEKEVEPGES